MKNDRMKLTQISVKGFKSFCPQGQKIEFGDVTVLLGANGSGKSNLVSFFKMLNYMTTGGLQLFIGKNGGAEALLFYGAKNTDKIEFALTFNQAGEEGIRSTKYDVKLVHALPDRLIFAGETVKYERSDASKPLEYYVTSGNGESGLSSDEGNTSKVLHSALSKIRIFHFHDTSDTAKIKTGGYISDAHYLRSDAGNLAAFLRNMKNAPDTKKYYNRIVRHIKRVMPQFRDFVLEPLASNKENLRLNWVDESSDYLFGPHQISDGSLRFMSLATLLLGPPSDLPGVIVIDEPELGLHPAAIHELAGMIKTASANAQVFVSTQSTRLVDEFELDQLVVVERNKEKNCSVFKRLEKDSLLEWLDRYSLSELWEKNVLGGRP